jgi:hypothetical protein
VSFAVNDKCAQCGQWFPRGRAHGCNLDPAEETTDPVEKRGWSDCLLGVTCNPFGVEGLRARWAKGHDRAYALGLGKYERFGKKRRSVR